MRTPVWLNPWTVDFPPIERAMTEPNGLLAIGGDLSEQRLLNAYRHGIFPWYETGQPILWWSPAPRAVLFPEKIHISRSLKKSIRTKGYAATFDRAFRDVMQACAEPRKSGAGTWITHEMVEAYCALHEKGYAHSAETWKDEKLVGGIYGIALGKLFFGESMFCRETDASKIALVTLMQQLQAQGFKLLDCQVGNTHTFSLGAKEISRKEFKSYLLQYIPNDIYGSAQKWDNLYNSTLTNTHMEKPASTNDNSIS